MNECDCVSGSKCCQALEGRGRRERPGEGGGPAVGLPVEIECKCRGNLCHTRLRALLNIAARYAASLEPQKPKRQRQPPCHMPHAPCAAPPFTLSHSATSQQQAGRQAGSGCRHCAVVVGCHAPPHAPLPRRCLLPHIWRCREGVVLNMLGVLSLIMLSGCTASTCLAW